MDNETIQYDCFRGCVITKGEEADEPAYRAGCCKLSSRNILKGIEDGSCPDIFEVRFKNTRKGFYINDSQQNLALGDFVVVEAANGYDLGIVTLAGPIVARQMACKGVVREGTEFKKIYRKAKPLDIQKWQAAIAREQDTMIKARKIAAELGLEMKIGDVEFQGDGTKAIFYYIADGRVDFRQLIKVFAEEFRIRIEMKQIGARQEAGLIGGLGVCGRELCCANYITSFQSISTSAARCQDLSLNPQKLAGQCGKLKCCLNYEVANYLDAQSRIPRVQGPLEFEDGLAWLRKTDILREIMYFSYDKNSDADLYALDAEEVQEILEMNRNGEKPESLKTEPEPYTPEFVTSVGDDSISRFDAPKRKRKRSKGRKGRGAEGRSAEGRADGRQAEGRLAEAAPAAKQEGQGGQRRNDQRHRSRNRNRQRPEKKGGE
jgi:cell fate regulator YaaT (PSP1 superfamily)